MKTSRQKLAAELILFLEGSHAPLNAKSWKKTLSRLNQQHNRIRAWRAGNGENAASTGINGFRLLK